MELLSLVKKMSDRADALWKQTTVVDGVVRWVDGSIPPSEMMIVWQAQGREFNMELT